jgi:hypothetical protein
MGGRVINQRVKALSIGWPVFDVLKSDALAARVLANYHCACNLVTSKGEIIALVSPMIGNGPLNIVIEENTAFEHVEPGLPAAFSDGQLVLGDSLVVSLDGARLWRAEVNWECLIARRRRLEDSLATLCDWLFHSDFARGLLSLVLHGREERREREDGTRSAHDLAFLAAAWVGIKGLLQALPDGDRSGVRENAALLAGLGPGLTPAGDDYLVGLMAGLRVWPDLCGLSPDDACQIIVEATEGRTTILSSAFLHSAQEGLFGENWHRLLAQLAGGTVGIQQAAKRMLSSGATSGADALAGFLSPYLWPQQ